MSLIGIGAGASRVSLIGIGAVASMVGMALAQAPTKPATPQAPATPPAQGTPPPSLGGFTLRSSAIADTDRIPDKFTCEGEDKSPPLEWTGAPEGTQSFAIILEDLDTPRPFVHWVIYSIPATVTKLPEGLPRERELTEPIVAKQGSSSFGKDNTGYRGPATPRGDKPHRYQFTIYALKGNPELQGGLTGATLRQRTKDIVIGEAKLTGTFSRARKPGETPPGVQEKEKLRPPPGAPSAPAAPPPAAPGSPSGPPTPPSAPKAP